jgi:hypothetical protein
MPIDGQDLRGLLRSLDDPTSLEHPRGFDAAGAKNQLRRLAERLTADFGSVCPCDDQVEDASFCGRVEIPASATTTGERLVIVVSNFGRLAVLTVENPGVWTDAEAAGRLDPHDANRVDVALAGLEYVQIAEDPLWEAYEGAAPLRGSGVSPTWWDRFFDYL